MRGNRLFNFTTTRQTRSIRMDNASNIAGRIPQRLLEETSGLICAVGLDGRILHVNSAITRILGYKPEEVIGREYWKLAHPEDMPNVRDGERQCVETGSLSGLVNRYLHRNGHAVHTSWTCTFVPEDGVIYGIAHDVSELVEAQQASGNLAHSMARMLDTIAQGYFTLSKDWELIHVNRIFEETFHVHRTDVLGRSIFDHLPGFLKSDLHARLQETMDSCGRLETITSYPAFDKIFEINASGGPEGLSVYFRDITDHKNIENRLYWQADLLDRTTDVIAVCRTDGVIVFWNRRAESILGWIAEEVVGKNARKLFGPPDEAVSHAIATVLRHGEWSGELTRQNKYGEQLTFDCRWVYMPETDVEAECVLLVCTDVTERRKLEAQFQRAQRLESIGTLAGGIAHDLNNVLAPILLAMDILRAQIHSREGRMILETIEASAQRAASMVNQLLLYSRGVEGDRHPINPVPVIHDVVEMLRQTFPKSITIDQEVDEFLPHINVDPTQLHQVLLNLCLNARDAVGETGRIEIKATNYFIDKLNSSKALQAGEGNYVHISVRDDGAGIPPEIMDKIFEPFFTTKEQGKGTGLGLSTVLAIVKSLGGFIELTSEAGYGSKFDIYLPGVSGLQDASAEEASPRMPHGFQELILVVDDEKPVRDITRETLELYGYRVITARDGAEAIALYAQRKDEIHVVLTDMMMPVMDGPALVSALQHINPNVHIIGASGLGSQGGVAKAANAGVLHFLPKPYSASALLCLLRNLLNHDQD